MEIKEDPTFSDVEDEPTPFSLGGGSRSPRRRRATEAGAGKRTPLGMSIAIGVILVAGLAVIFIFAGHPPGQDKGSTASGVQVPGGAVPTVLSPQAPSAPTIIIAAQKTKNGLRLVVQWSALPDGTTRINVFYSPVQNGKYRLIGSISIPPSAGSGGDGFLNIPNGNPSGYYYGAAVADDGTPLYTSSSTVPTDIPPPDVPVDNGPNSDGGNGQNSSTGQTAPPPDNNESTTPQAGPTGNDSSTAPVQNFLVQHFDQKIQISWQSLPAGTFQIVVSRSAAYNGPWTPILTETNILTDGPYSIEIVDDTLGDAYYYQMYAYDQNGDALAVYGPILLGPL